MVTPPPLVIFLTATIKPKENVLFLERKDFKQRFNDYDIALKKWSNTGLDIIFCENSGYDITTLEQKYKNIHFFQFEGLNYDQNLGKGFGEHLILEYIIQKNSHLFSDDQFFVKITGRLFVKNILSYLEGFQKEFQKNNQLLLYSDFRLNLVFRKANALFLIKNLLQIIY